jgi:hypothetical protein
MNTVYFYLYLIVVISSTVALNILRCVFNIKIFDIFFYPNNNNNIVENSVYLSSHILVNFALGYLFGFEVILGMLVKIMLFEVYLYITERCDIFNTSKVSHLIIIIIISLVSYTAGCLAKKLLS